jgi:DNA-binding CsgD family transcriptional regulator/tetratricopeptide (TPR) repeat protein
MSGNNATPSEHGIGVPVAGTPIQRLATDGDGPIGSSTLLTWLAGFIRVPESLIVELWPNENVASVLDGYEAAGLIERGSGPGMQVAVALSDAEFSARTTEAQQRWGSETLVDRHRAAVEYWLENNDLCSAAFHLEQLGRRAEAAELVKSAWRYAHFDVGYDRFLRMIRRLDDDSRAEDHLVLLAVQRLLSTLPWRTAVAPQLDLELINGVPGSLVGFDPRSRILVTAAVILALSASGRLTLAISFGEAFVATELDVSAEWGLLPIVWNALAEAYISAGSPRKAIYYASKAQALAVSQAWYFGEFRATSVESLALALNGEYVRAIAQSRRARDIAAREGWGLTEGDLPLLLGEVLVSSAHLDSVALQQLAGVLYTTFPNNRLWITTAFVCEAMAYLCLNDIQKGLSFIRRALNGTDELGLIGIIRGFALGLQADLLLAQDAADETLAVLEHAESSLGHAICFDMQRSTAYLILGQPGKVLAATDSCLAMGPDHCLRTLPPILFRRAVAYEQMNLPGPADRSFHEAYLLISDSQSLTPLLNLPAGAMKRLWRRLQEANPEYAADIERILGRTDQMPRAATADESEAVSLTAREVQLATMLRDGSSNAEIADALFLSPNTVKAHIRNLYKKLGAHTRTEAVNTIESMNFKPLQVPRRP